jgi:CPA2 family monovalent cation:H+ antiporter-2
LFELGILLIVLGTIARRLSLTSAPLYLLAGLAIGDGGLSLVPISGA